MVGRARARRSRAGHARDVAAVAVAGQQHGMVVLDAGDEVSGRRSSGTTPSRRPTRGWLIEQLAARRGVGRGRAARCRSPRSRSPSCRGCTAREPDAWARVARVLLPHDWLTWRLTGEFVTDRGDASGTGYWSPAATSTRSTCSRSSTPTSTGPRGCPRVLGPPSAGTTSAFGRDAVVAPGTGDNMAAALGARARAGRRRDLARHVGHRVRGERRRRPPTRPARSPASPTRPAASSRSCARSTRPRSPTRSRAGSASTTPSSTRSRSTRRPAPAASCVVPVLRRRAHAEPARRHGRDRRAAHRRRRASSSPRAAVEGVVCGLLDGLDALTARGRRAPTATSCSSAAARRSRGVPTGRRRPRPDARSSCPTRASTSRPARACRPPRCCATAMPRRSRAAWELGARRRRSSPTRASTAARCARRTRRARG